MLSNQNFRAELFRKFAHFCIVLGHFIAISYVNFGFGFIGLFLGLLLLYYIKHTGVIRFATSVRVKSFGQYYLFIGLIITDIIYIFYPNYNALVFAHFALGVGDVLAGFVPYFLLPRHKPLTTRVVIYSFIVFCLVNAAFLYSLKINLINIFFLTAILGMVESYSKKGTDNLTIPIVAYILMLFAVV